MINGSTESTQEANRVLLEQIRDLLAGLSGHQDPLDKYVIHDEDSAQTGTEYKYFGYVTKSSSEEWIIVRQNTTSFPYFYRYANVSNNPTDAEYVDAWAGRVGLNYTYLPDLTGV